MFTALSDKYVKQVSKQARSKQLQASQEASKQASKSKQKQAKASTSKHKHKQASKLTRVSVIPTPISVISIKQIIDATPLFVIAKITHESRVMSH